MTRNTRNTRNIFFSVSLLSTAVTAHPLVEADYFNIDNHITDNVQAVALKAGFQFNIADSNFSITPSVSIGKEMGAVSIDETNQYGHFTENLKLDHFYMTSLNTQYTFGSGTGPFVYARYSRLWEKDSDSFTSQTNCPFLDCNQSIKFKLKFKSNLYGAGLGYQFSDNLSVRAGLMKNSQNRHVRIVNAGLRYTFD